MDKDPDIDIIELADTVDKEEEGVQQNFDDEYDDEPRSSFTLQKKTLYIGGAIVLVVIVIVALLSSSGESDISKADFSALSERIEHIEARVSDLEGLEGRISVALQAQKSALKETVTEAAGTGGTMVQQLDLLARKVEALQQKMGSVVKEAQAIRADKTERTQVQKARYHVVNRGDSLYGIAKKYGLSVEKLCALNKISTRKPIHPGQKLLVSVAAGS